ncbi:aminotransferase class I/II-fold pyridoxal phosphate-dependent enzyme [Vibrio nigripulchritudo]|uniref:aminotransferase class I/II-fold pyridoxal phosphate-dependent enzyme n=1 Tax=Vibrio nigripulchritudo TaxID=28173 RepID=UPI0003B1D8EF|nr:aminotransferase class I/II-fold pyridoxal phosphate-dependent enzyme [Vibrio nigripulchritudo]CCN70110.1 putative transcriptional regulatory protein ptsJ [Vibrio nigripulchritudo SFn118]
MKIKIKGQTGQEIFESVRSLIASGELEEGGALPPVRELAQEVGVNRNTVASVYQRLVKAGLAETKGRLGTRVKARQTAGQHDGITETQLVDLADGNLKREWLPDLNQIAQQSDFKQFVYGESPILPEVESYGREWFKSDCPEVMGLTITGGAVDSLERLLATHLLPGDKIAVEDPCYLGSANAIKLAGMISVGVSMDSEGMLPEELDAQLKKGARAVLFTPRAQNPTGCCYSKARAKEIRDVLARYPNVPVLVDDHYALLSTSEYQNLIADNTQHWAVYRSVSKGLGPDVRLAFVAADPVTTSRLQSRLIPGMTWVSRVLQAMVFTALQSETVQKQLTDTSEKCRQSRLWLIHALAKNGLSVSEDIEGVNVWVPVNGDSQGAAYELSKMGWLVRPGSLYDIDGQSKGLRITTVKLDEEQAQRLAEDIVSVCL